MKQKLLFSLFIVLFSITVQAQPTATMAMNQTICPGNSATITLTGTPNCAATITSSLGFPITFTVFIGATGTSTFQTPILEQTTTYTLTQVRNIQTFETAIITGVSVTITVVPNGCTQIQTNGDVGINSRTICSAGECRTLVATPPDVPSTTTYEVSSIPYCPQPFLDPSYTLIDANYADDIWSSSITLPFNFSFFNQNYTSCHVGTNGVISFNPQTPGGICDYPMGGLSVPNPDFVHKNAIFGVFQDTNASIGASPADVQVSYKLIGTYPCRKLVVNFYHLGQFQCNQTRGLQTYQIVMYEVSNIIEVYVQNRNACTTWQTGSGVIGIINPNGTLGYTPASRNTGSWNAANEAWRFTPSGPNVPVTTRWIQSPDGNTIATGNTVVVCPFVTTSYRAESTYQISGIPFVVSSPQNLITVSLDQSQQPVDISVCYQDSGTYTTDLTINDAIIIGGLNPVDYEITYFTSQQGAETGANPIASPQSYSFTGNQTIYVSVYRTSYDCNNVKSFQLVINNAVAAPTGVSPQTLFSGQTLGDLAVNGQNVQWYDAPEGGNQLPNSTVPQNGVTYYATQTVNNCESKTTTTSARLAVVVNVTLDTNEFNRNTFSFYPNPTSDILTLTSNLADVKLEVFNVLSQKISDKIIQNGSNTINLSNFASGVYLFRLSLDGKTTTYRVVKN